MRLFLLLLFCLSLLTGPTQASQTVTDDLGRRMTLPHPPRRIISLAPSVTEILYAVGAEKKLAADTAYCDYPPQAKALPHVGGVINPSAEQIVALHPDLIIMADQTLPAAQADALAARWRAPVYVTAAATYAQVEQDIAHLGALVGQPKPTRETLRRMQAAEAAIKRAVQNRPKPRVFVVVWDKPLVTAGGNSFIGDLIRQAGGTNIAEEAAQSYPSYSPERLLREEPDLLLTGMQHATVSFPGASALRAARRRRIYAVISDTTDRPGPRLGEGLQAVARALHPEAFPR